MLERAIAMDKTDELAAETFVSASAAVSTIIAVELLDEVHGALSPKSHAREEIRRCSGTQFDPKVVEVFSTIPEEHWIDLREHLGSPFRLAHLKNL